MSASKIKREKSSVRLDLSPEEHRRLRVASAIEGVSMATFARLRVVAALEGVKDPQKKLSEKRA